MKWTKSSACKADSDFCLEIARMTEGNIAIRNSRFRDSIIGSPEEWEAFKEGVRRGDFDQV